MKVPDLLDWNKLLINSLILSVCFFIRVFDID
jgi:hypothetical protein